MPLRTKNFLVFQKVTGLALLALLAGCATHDNPGSPDNAELVALAEQLHAKGNDGAAANLYMRVLQNEPDNTELRKEFGEMLESHGDLDAAATQYRLALGLPAPEPYRTAPEIASSDIGLLRDYGRVLIKLNRPDLAQPVYMQALKLAPDDIRALNGLGVTLDERGDHLAAQKAYKQAAAEKPDDIETLTNLGHSYVLSGSYDDAIHLLEPHLSDSGATPALRQNLAEAYAMNGMDADAERVSRYDLSPQQIKHNMAYYHARLAHMATGGALYADLGSFPTEEMAAAHAEEIKTKFPAETEGLAVKARTKVDSVGGVPSFTVRVTGFERTGTLKAFCLKLREHKVDCAPRMKM